MRIGFLFSGFVAALWLQSVKVMAEDWPQYRGVDAAGISLESTDIKWGEAGPETVWRVPVNTGFSSFSVGEGRVFTQVVRDGKPPREVCLALDAKTGKTLWSSVVGVGKGYSGGGKGDGPRSTPAVSDGRVYVFSPEMVVFCFDIRTGDKIWSRDIVKQHAGRNIGWRIAASPVVDGDLVYVSGGGKGQALLALDKKTGDVVWKGLSETMTHSTPTVATIHGVRQVIYYLKSGLVSVTADAGKELWRFPFKFSTSSAITPVVCGDSVFCSAGYGVGGGACRIVKQGAGFKVESLWLIPGNKEVANHWSTPVSKDGFLYGMFSFKGFRRGPLKCVNVSTGKVMWSQSGFGQGNVILVGKKLVALTDGGEVVVVEATPTAYREVCRTQAVKGKSYSTPAFSAGRIYVRSVAEGVCLAP
ncbi:MAG: PQQ-like beta-propeller repeat protein [Kiritimatiellae bacterium]|nr:PQQ-like beta-propeller repeat protein [Kiritimatiellia bacterium]